MIYYNNDNDNDNHKGWWASTGLCKAPRSRSRGAFATPNHPQYLF
jgi:hypothetical protein